MQKKFNGEHLKNLRREAGLTQVELAKRLGISRETVIAIEHSHPGTIDTISLNVVRDWKKACGKASHDTMEDFIQYVKDFLSIH